MSRVAVFVDAGYVFAQGSLLLAGRKLPRGETLLDHAGAIASFATFAERVAGVAVLRVYWYDGTSTGPTAQHLVGIKPSRGSQSLFLLQEADTTHEWTDAEVAPFLSCKPKPISVPGSVPPGAPATATEVVLTPLNKVAAKVAAALEKSVLLTLIEAFEGSGQLPRDVDRQLLAGGRSAIGRDLGPAEKKSVRNLFLSMCRDRLAQ